MQVLPNTATLRRPTVSKPILIEQPNISLAWAEAFLAVRDVSKHKLSPLTLSFTGFEGGEVQEDAGIRSALDLALAASEMQKVQTVANTIFPVSLWRYAKGDRKSLYAQYRENLPEYVAMEPNKNQRGLYFGRLIAFDMDHKTGDQLAYVPKGTIPEDGNQLEFIIQHCKPGVRHSMFQASTFDPARDHTQAGQLGFPCLQHVTFEPDFKAGTLALNAFYATQQLFAKGYGNYLGLARLGLFMAGEIKLSLDRVSCFIGVEKMEQKPTAGQELSDLEKVCEEALAAQPEESR
jgi:hypothetical protein